MGRPKIGVTSVAISLTLEKGLLKRADAYAKSQGLKRAQLIAQALKTTMGGQRGVIESGACVPAPRW